MVLRRCASDDLDGHASDSHVVCSADGDDRFADDDRVLRRCTSNDLDGHASDSHVVCSAGVTDDSYAHAIDRVFRLSTNASGVADGCDARAAAELNRGYPGSEVDRASKANVLQGTRSAAPAGNKRCDAAERAVQTYDRCLRQAV